MNFKYRYIARVTLEAITPLIIGSDTLLYDQDKPVDLDFNSLPYIPGSALAGFLRAQVKNELNIDFDSGKENPTNPIQINIFGDERKNSDKQSFGSSTIISDAYLMNSDGIVLQDLTPPSEIKKDIVLQQYLKLPLRQHTQINHLGSASDGSKFDQEFVYKGSRFKFEISLELKGKNDEIWKSVLELLKAKPIYLGSGQYNNFGELKIHEIESRAFNLDKDLTKYLDIDTANLNSCLNGIKENSGLKEHNNFTKISLNGHNSFFHFGSGMGDEDVDDANYKELVLTWDKNNKADWQEFFVIPGTSIKGSLAHRTAFYYNLENGINIECLIDTKLKTIKPNEIEKIISSDLQNDEKGLNYLHREAEDALKILNQDTNAIFEEHTGEQNKAVREIFGTAKNSKTKNGIHGKIIIKDVYLRTKDYSETIFNHNKIDRFAGGTVDSNLFNERALELDSIVIEIQGDDIAQGDNNTLDNEYLQKAISDLKNGLLAVGGKSSKGHGFFTTKNKDNE